MAAPLLSQVIFKIRVPSKKPKTLNPMNITLFLFLGGEVLRSKLGCPYFVGIGMSFCPLFCTDLVYSFLLRLSSAPTHLRLVR